MKHISKRKLCAVLLSAVLLLQASGCASLAAYEGGETLAAYVPEQTSGAVVTGFAAGLCVTSGDYMPDGALLHEPEVAGLFDVTDCEVLYAKNIFQSVEPASITKLLTALVAFKYGNLDDMVTVSDNVWITESGAKLCGFEPGDVITLRDALYGLLVYSGNDAGVVIAEHISGSVSAFAEKMNEEAAKLGATQTHFVNPHGLTAEGHVTTAYDLYLILSALLQYPEFLEIVQTKLYTCTPRTSADEASAADETSADASESPATEAVSETPAPSEAAGETETPAPSEAAGETETPAPSEAAGETETPAPSESRTLVWNTTNAYFKGDAAAPDGVTVLGGKTGTTAAAGHCLILLAEDVEGKQYISVVMHALTKAALYEEMTDLLKKIVE